MSSYVQLDNWSAQICGGVVDLIGPLKVSSYRELAVNFREMPPVILALLHSVTVTCNNSFKDDVPVFSH